MTTIRKTKSPKQITPFYATLAKSYTPTDTCYLRTKFSASLDDLIRHAEVNIGIASIQDVNTGTLVWERPSAVQLT